MWGDRTSAAQAALDARNARYRAGQTKQSVDDEEAAERVKGRIEQAERAVEKFVARRLKAVQPGLEKVGQVLCIPLSLLAVAALIAAERAVEKFVARRLKAVQPGLEKVGVQWFEIITVKHPDPNPVPNP